MGEVYRATDTKLGRDVALKILPGEMARDPERLARFRREARAVAALNHPHIVTIFSVEEADGIHFLTMELVEGQSLERHEEAIQTLERAATISRSPMLVGLLGLAYARAGRRDDATGLLQELEDRRSRGEYVPAFASLTIFVGLGDVTMIRQSLAKAMAEQTPPLSLRANGGGVLLDKHRKSTGCCSNYTATRV